MTIPALTLARQLAANTIVDFASNVGQKYQIRSHQDWREKLRLKQRVL
jgi:hypothetical protein